MIVTLLFLHLGIAHIGVRGIISDPIYLLMVTFAIFAFRHGDCFSAVIASLTYLSTPDMSLISCEQTNREAGSWIPRHGGKSYNWQQSTHVSF